MRRVLFLDLDDTLFHSRHKAEPEAGSEAVAWASDGTPDSFMSTRQRAFFDWICDGAEVVPTTGRSASAYRRVSLPFSGWAICSFGGRILRPDGSSDPRWHSQMAPQAHGSRETLNVLLHQANAAIGDRPARARLIEDDGLPLYLSVKSESEVAITSLMPALCAWLPTGYTVHINGASLTVLPPFLGKEHAVRWFIETVAGPDALAIGAGDSTSDGPFLAACDYALTPSRSQLLTHLLVAS